MGMDAAPISASAAPASAPGALRRALAHPLALWIGFLLVHLVIGGLALEGGKGLGDVYFVYKPWAQLAAQGTQIVGVDSDWVYPFGALVPVMLPLLFGVDNYVGGWLTMVLLLDAAAFATLIVGRDPRRIVAAWWWLGFAAPRRRGRPGDAHGQLAGRRRLVRFRRSARPRRVAARPHRARRPGGSRGAQQGDAEELIRHGRGPGIPPRTAGCPGHDCSSASLGRLVPSDDVVPPPYERNGLRDGVPIACVVSS